MNIVFYSSNSNIFDVSSFHYCAHPSNSDALKDFVQKWSHLCTNDGAHQKDNFFIVTSAPALFLLDFKNGKLCAPAVPCTLISNDGKNDGAFEPFEITQKFVNAILSYKADLAIALSFWQNPYDFQSLQDAQIANVLRQNGVKALAQSSACAFTCFDKSFMARFLAQNNFASAKSVYVHHELFKTAHLANDVATNVYQAHIFEQINELKAPLVIKNTTGASSNGIEVAKTHKEVFAYLKSKRNKADLLVEEYAFGIQCGLEVYGQKGAFVVGGLFLLATNCYGVTSSIKSAKFGPLSNAQRDALGITNAHFDNLQKMVLRLATLLDICGMAQIDLVFNKNAKNSKNAWTILEVNPRLSGMTNASLLSAGLSIFDVLCAVAMQKPFNLNNYQVLSIKVTPCDAEQFEQIAKMPGVKKLFLAKNDKAKQIREAGYLEILFAAKDTWQIVQDANYFAKLYPNFAPSVTDALKLIPCT